jgi:hypothetical protein
LEKEPGLGFPWEKWKTPAGRTVFIKQHYVCHKCHKTVPNINFNLYKYPSTFATSPLNKKRGEKVPWYMVKFRTLPFFFSFSSFSLNLSGIFPSYSSFPSTFQVFSPLTALFPSTFHVFSPLTALFPLYLSGIFPSYSSFSPITALFCTHQKSENPTSLLAA